MFTLKIIDGKTQAQSFLELDEFEIISQSASKDIFDKLTENHVCNKTRYNIGVIVLGRKDSQHITKYLDKYMFAFIMNSQGKTVEVIKAVEHIWDK